MSYVLRPGTHSRRRVPCLAWALTTAALLLSGAPASAASFDCRAATTLVERMICTDSRLSEGDERVALAYRQALQSAARPEAVRADERQWVKVTGACKTPGCVAEAQESRLAQLAGGQDTSDPTLVGGTIAVGGHVTITITALSGLGSRTAAIDARMTERDAVAACHGYVGEPVPTRKCIADWMKEGGGTANVAYRGDCVSGIFGVGGRRAAFVGRNAAFSGTDPEEPEYLIRLPETGEFLQDAGASGYPVLLSAFMKLCPGVAERAMKVRR